MELWKMRKVASKAVPYVIHGEAKDHEWVIEHQEELHEYTLEEMRKDGYIPIIDMSPGMKWDYDHDREICIYSLKLMGYKVGQAKARQYYGAFVSQGIVLSKDFKKVSISEL